jgi:hypothetical protein
MQIPQDLPFTSRYAALALCGAAKLITPKASTTPALIMIRRLFTMIGLQDERLWISSIVGTVKVTTTSNTAVRRHRKLGLSTLKIAELLPVECGSAGLLRNGCNSRAVDAWRGVTTTSGHQ